MANELIVDHPLRLKYKIIYGEMVSWAGDVVKIANGFYSMAGCGFVPSGKVEYVYE